jgi:hypothetical protein
MMTQPTVQEMAIRPVPGVDGATFSNVRQRGYTERLSHLAANRVQPLVAFVPAGSTPAVREAVQGVLRERARVI